MILKSEHRVNLFLWCFITKQKIFAILSKKMCISSHDELLLYLPTQVQDYWKSVIFFSVLLMEESSHSSAKSLKLQHYC
jgi:hypothetical protein